MTYKIDPLQVFEHQRRAVQDLYELGDRNNFIDTLADVNDTENSVSDRVELTNAVQPVSVDQLILPKLLLVKVKQKCLKFPEYSRYKDQCFILLGEIIQMPGHVTMVNIATKEIITVIHSDALEMMVDA